MARSFIVTALLALSFKAYATGSCMGYMAPSIIDMEREQKALDSAKKARERRIEESNVFTDRDYNQILAEKTRDLKSINAILIRFKEDFRKVREENSPRAQHAKEQITQIFKTDLWKYFPDKNLNFFINHLHRDYRSSDISKSEKLSQLKNKITNIKKQLIFLRDYCAKKKETPFQVFLFLWAADFALAVHKYNKDWDAYAKVLKILDEGLN